MKELVNKLIEFKSNENTEKLLTEYLVSLQPVFSKFYVRVTLENIDLIIETCLAIQETNNQFKGLFNKWKATNLSSAFRDLDQQATKIASESNFKKVFFNETDDQDLSVLERELKSLVDEFERKVDATVYTVGQYYIERAKNILMYPKEKEEQKRIVNELILKIKRYL